jgi:hypothetical protein
LIVAKWEKSGRWYEPSPSSDWEIAEARDSLAEASGVALGNWTTLAQAFVDRLGEANVQRLVGGAG